MVDLTTTNVLLGIMAAVSLIEGIALIAAGIIGLRLYREVRAQIDALEQRHLAPLTAKVLPLIDRAAPIVDEAKVLTAKASPILDEARVLMQSVQRMSEKAEHSLSRVDDAVQGTMNTAEQAVDRVQVGVRRTTATAVGVVRGVRTAIETFLTDQPHQSNGAGAQAPR